MSPEGQHQVPWLQLSSELWGLIFSRLKPVTVTDVGFARSRTSSQAAYHGLKMVCKRFHTVFEEDPKLSSTLILPKSVAGSRVLSLLRWIRKHYDCVEHLSAVGDTPWLHAALALLVDGCLMSACFAHISHPPLTLMPSFQCLRHCAISFPENRQLSLHALAALPKLTSLALEHGSFTDMNAAAHLTSLSLSLSDASCSGDCTCVTSLLKLELAWSKLQNFHKRGLYACSHLQYLYCEMSGVSGAARANEFGLAHDICVMPDIQKLTALTRLEFCTEQLVCSLDWIADLRSLKCVEAFNSGCGMHMPASMSCLTNLQDLKVVCTTREDKAKLDIAVDLTALVSLQSVYLSSAIITCSSLVPLTCLKSLKCIAFKCEPNEGTQRQLIQLSRELGSNRPDIELQT